MSNSLVMVDTSVWIFALSRNFLPRIKERVDMLLRENAVAICPMIKLELLGGTKTKREFQRLRSRLNSLCQIEINDDVWYKAAQMTFFLHRKGITVPYTDILIGVSAQSEGALLLHADEHFDLLAKNFGLSVESLIDAVRVSSLRGKNNPSAGNKKEGRRIGGEIETGGERK